MKTVVIAGPTASGKSGFAVDLALKINGEIISADSMQIYRGMGIGTAKISTKEKKGIGHRLIDIADPDEEFSVANFKDLALRAEEEIRAKGKTPIVAGGTGLYINSLIYDYNFSDAVPDRELREHYQSVYKENGAEALYTILCEKSPERAALIHPNNVKRVIRTLEIVESDLSQPKKLLRNDVVIVVLNAERAVLYERIDSRVDEMFAQGLSEEIESLLRNGYGFGLQSMQAIGYKEFGGFYNGEYNLEQVKYLIKLNSRHYAKRQICWFKGIKTAKWFDTLSERQECEKYILDNLE